jgi:hypothetical protein
MKKFLISALLLTSINVIADVNFESGNNKNHIITTFQNNDCQDYCDLFNEKLYKYEPKNLFVLRFDDKKYKDLHKLHSTINDVNTVTPQFFLNYSVINYNFFEIVDMRELSDGLVGNLKINFDKKELKATFSPVIEIKNDQNLNTLLKGAGETSLNKDSFYDNKDLTLFVAITTPVKSVYNDSGKNEGHFTSNNHNVLLLKSKSSNDMTWKMDIPYQDFDEGSLSFVLWIEDDHKNIIQASSNSFYRFDY